MTPADDRALLESAAKAAGIKLFLWSDSWDSEPGESGFQTADFGRWNPLTHDGDALRLAVKLGIHISPDCEHETSEPEARAATPSAAHLMQEKHKGDRYAATRRAIVRAAAALAPPETGEKR